MNLTELLQILACPKCHGDLAHDPAGGFICGQCELVYPIREDIPIMIIAEAIPLEQWRKEHPCES